MEWDNGHAKKWRSVRAKIRNDTYTQLQFHCEQEGLTVSSFIRDLIEERINEIVPMNKAGKNSWKYDKSSDTFKWVIEFDDSSKRELAESVSPVFLEDLNSQIEKALSSRSHYLQKSKPDSVPIPTKVKKLRGV